MQFLTVFISKSSSLFLWKYPCGGVGGGLGGSHSKVKYVPDFMAKVTSTPNVSQVVNQDELIHCQ